MGRGSLSHRHIGELTLYFIRKHLWEREKYSIFAVY